MYTGLWILNIYLLTGVSAFQTILVANPEGIHVIDPTSREGKTVLPFEKGANSVGFDLETGYVYGILKSIQETQHRIVRTKILEAPNPHSCNQKELAPWCHRNKFCNNICSSTNPYKPETVFEPYRCLRANNLVLDWIHSNLYWTCDPKASLTASLNIATLEGGGNRTILTRTKQIQSIDIDPFHRKIFLLESNNLWSVNLHGKEERTVYQFPTNGEDISNINLDIDLKIIYVVGATSMSTDETFLASMGYDGSNYKRLYSSSNTELEFGPKIVKSTIYWLTLSNNSESININNTKMEKIHISYDVTKWSLVDLDAQKLESGSYCDKLGCSHNCSLSKWMKISCHCPSGKTLGADKKTCYDNVIQPHEDPSETSLPLDSSTSSGGGKEDKTTQESMESGSSNSTSSGEPEVAQPKSVVTTSETVVQSTVNRSRDLAESAVVVSQNATEAAGVVTASSNMTLFYTVVTTIWISVFIVVVVVRRRAKMGNYQPADPRERTDFLS